MSHVSKTAKSKSTDPDFATAFDYLDDIKNSIAKAMPGGLAGNEEARIPIDLTKVDFNSLGSKKDVVTVTVVASSGTVAAEPAKGIVIYGGGNYVHLVGTVSTLMDYFGKTKGLSYTGEKDVFGANSALLTLWTDNGKKQLIIGEIPVSLADVPDTLTGTSGDDVLIGEAGKNFIYGLAGNDLLEGRGGNDEIFGEAGNDTIDGGEGADTLDGGAGDDVLYYRASVAGVVVNLAVGADGKQTVSGGDAQGDVVSGFEHVYASEFADLVTGNDGRNILFGYGGNDTILGLGGDDVIRGGAGADVMDGGDGLDWVRYLESPTGVTVSLMPGVLGIGGDAEGDSLTGFENIQGSEHSDRLIGDAGNNYFVGFTGSDYIDGGAGNDSIRGGEGADTMLGGDGIDTLQYIDLPEGVTIDLRLNAVGLQSASGGEAQGDVISGFENVFGGEGGDRLTGDAGRNYLYGYGGNDTLAGREGKDVLRGFEGADHFVFDTALAASNVDRVLDFETGTDKLVLDDAVFAGLTPGALGAANFLVSDMPAATTADHRIIYHTTTGTLYFDADGVGGIAPVAFAQLTSLPMVHADDFLIV